MGPLYQFGTLMASGRSFCAYVDVRENNKALYKSAKLPRSNRAGMNPSKTQTKPGYGLVLDPAWAYVPVAWQAVVRQSL